MTLLQRYMSGYRTLSCGIPLLLFALLFQLVALPLTGHADDAVEIRDVRHWENRDFIRFVFDLSLPVEFTSGRIANPERLFFDLKNTKLAKGLRKSFEIRHEFVKALRLGQYSSDVARIVFDLQTQSYNFKVMNLEDPARLVIDIYTVGGKGNAKEDLRAETEIDALRPDEKDLATDRREDSYAPDINAPVSNPRNRFIKRTVVVDAGHGGHDPGAVGPSGLYEKNVVLDIAIRVRAIMKKDYPSCDVVLTRETDVFIPLPDRAKIANDHKADLFVSIHANASPNRKARGIETYLLNWTNDVEAMKVAARENAISLKKMKQMKGDLGIIFASLDRELKRDQSINAAGYIQKSLVKSMERKYPEVSDLGVKQALFYVLVGATMPSSLVEVSFISNPMEEKLLSTDSYRQYLARSIADGIYKYFTSQPAQHIAFNDRESPEQKAPTKQVKYSRSKSGR
jgi:N-acetylmuramoyl-L-alanine amidase